MKIGEKNYLLAEKRGCNFAPGDSSTNGSDIGNYRVFIWFINRDGEEVCGDITRHHSSVHMIGANMARIDGAANWHGYPYDWRKKLNYDGTFDIPFTREGILRYVNQRSAEPYDEVKWVTSFSFDQEPGRDFIPSSKIYKWAKQEHLESWNDMDGIKVRTYTGVWKFLTYRIRVFQGTRGPFERVTVFLEEGSEMHE